MTEVHKNEREATLSLKWLKQYFIFGIFQIQEPFQTLQVILQVQMINTKLESCSDSQGGRNRLLKHQHTYVSDEVKNQI